MATAAAPKKRIAVIQGRFTAPGINRNRREYKPDAVKAAVVDLQRRIDGDGRSTPVIFASHEARKASDTTKIIGKPTKVWQDESGAAWYRADVADTDEGRKVASLAANGYAPHVSLAGSYVGDVRIEEDEAGVPYLTGDALSYEGFDFTHNPATDEGNRVESVAFDSAATASVADAHFLDSFDGGALALVADLHEPINDTHTETEPMAETNAAPATPEAGSPAVIMVPLEVAQQMMDNAAQAAARAVADALNRPAPVALAPATLEPAAPTPAPAAPTNASTPVADSQAPVQPDRAAIDAAKEELRQELADKGVLPARTGIVRDSGKPEAEDLTTLSDSELLARSAARFDAMLQPAYESRGVVSKSVREGRIAV